MKKLAIYLFAVALIFSVAGNAWATPIWGSDASSELSGSRNSGIGGGIDASGAWDSGNFILGWEITESEGLWTYEYTITGTITGTTYPASHFILEVTDDENPFIVDSFSPDSGNPDPQYVYLTDSQDWSLSSSNPSMPNSIYGVKFDSESLEYSITTNREPVYGVFYAKDGNAGGAGMLTAWSNALNDSDYRINEPGIDWTTTDFIVRPNGAPVPEPATMLLLGSGLIGLAGIGRKKIKKARSS